MSDLETEFRAAYEEATALMKARERQAVALLNEIVAISEKTGVPFDAEISPLSQVYRPGSFEDKWGKTEIESRSVKSKYSDNYYDITIFDIVSNEASSGEHEGWQHSSVC